ncbi:MAG: OsmC family protein [Sphaerochaetaceae bacterium]|nr:OsmC family protein [Sphaerochaetaceae bacterium]
MLQTVKATAKKVPGGLTVENEARGFKLIMDEPVEMGGTNKGMNPIEALLCALGSCQVIVASAFAKAKNFKFEECFVEVEGDFDPEGFMGNPDIRNGFQDIRFKVHFKTDEAQDKCEEFAEFMAQQCPVEDNLVNGVKVTRTSVVIDK